MHVVRTMFFLHRPLTNRLTKHFKNFQDVHKLKGSICQQWWLRQSKTTAGRPEWKLIIKLRRRPPSKPLVHKLTRTLAAPPPTKKDRSWDDDEEDGSCLGQDLGGPFDNPEEHCYLVQLHSKTYFYVPPTILGMKLMDVCLSISVGQSIGLSFVPSHQASVNCAGVESVQVCDLVSAVLVPWYFPHYEALCSRR